MRLSKIFKNIANFSKNQFLRYKSKEPSILLQKNSLIATILGSILTLGFGYLTFHLTIKYGENIEEIKRFDTLIEKSQNQTDTLVGIINELRKQNTLTVANLKVLESQLAISEKQLKDMMTKDSLEMQTNIIKLTANSDELIFMCILIRDTANTRSWDQTYKAKILKELYDNLHEGIFNPILQKDVKCFEKWDGVLRQVGNLLASTPEYSGVFKFQPMGWSKERIEQFHDDIFIDIIKNCCELHNLIFSRILCKYKYHAAC
jgi:hypothetical protein